MANTEAHEEVFARAGAALDLLQRIDPLRFGRVRRHLQRVIITDHSGAAYVPDLGACMLGVSTVLNAPLMRLASMIIHEAVHARMRQAGISFVPAVWAREEALCVTESLAFLEKTEEGRVEADILRTLVSKEMDSEAPWFTEDRRWERFAGDMQRAGYPDWFIKLRQSLRY